MVRIILGLICGAVAAVILVFALETLGHLIFPPPEGLDLKDPEVQKTLMEQIPLGAKIAVLVAWFAGAFGGGIVATRITKQSWAAWAIGGFMLLMSGITLTMFPHPAWMIAGAVILPLLAAWMVSKTTTA
ncbi:MAG: hypothetical protein Hens3KO_14320 [Henriciella sp.]